MRSRADEIMISLAFWQTTSYSLITKETITYFRVNDKFSNFFPFNTGFFTILYELICLKQSRLPDFRSKESDSLIPYGS